MIYILEELNTFSDTWKMTFYFVFGIALLIGLFWTLYKMFKQEELKKNKLKENVIYNKPYDAIENMDDIFPMRKNNKTNIENYYDVYQNERRKNKYLKTENIESRVEENKKTNEDQYSSDNDSKEIKNKDVYIHLKNKKRKKTK